MLSLHTMLFLKFQDLWNIEHAVRTYGNDMTRHFEFWNILGFSKSQTGPTN